MVDSSAVYAYGSGGSSCGIQFSSKSLKMLADLETVQKWVGRTRVIPHLYICNILAKRWETVPGGQGGLALHRGTITKNPQSVNKVPGAESQCSQLADQISRSRAEAK